MTKYNWKNVPKAVNWIAKDYDGHIWGYESEPKLNRYSELWTVANSDVDCLQLGFTGDLFNNDDWIDSLEQRPEWSK